MENFIRGLVFFTINHLLYLSFKLTTKTQLHAEI